jgi:clan AA aspartic protease
MTSGFLNSDGAPVLSLEVRGPEGEQSVDAVIDTGFNGALTLPPEWIDALGLPQSGEESVSLADGRVIVVPLYVGYVILDEQAYEVDIAKAQTDPLAGTLLFWGFSLYVEFQSDGAVDVERLPESPGAGGERD